MPTLTYEARRSGRLTRAGRRRALHDIAVLRTAALASIDRCERLLGWRSLTEEETQLWSGALQVVHSLKLEEAHLLRHGSLPPAVQPMVVEARPFHVV